MSDDTYQAIIIGSGPAAHTAAVYAGRAELSPLMFEGFMAGGVAAGGQLTTTTEVENYPGFPETIGGPDLMMKMREQSLKYGATIRTETVERVDLSAQPYAVFTAGAEYKTMTIIIATGATASHRIIIVPLLCQQCDPRLISNAIVAVNGANTLAPRSHCRDGSGT